LSLGLLGSILVSFLIRAVASIGIAFPLYAVSRDLHIRFRFGWNGCVLWSITGPNLNASTAMRSQVRSLCDRPVDSLATLVKRGGSDWGCQGSAVQSLPVHECAIWKHGIGPAMGNCTSRKRLAECRRHSAQSRSDSVRSQTWWLGLRFSLLTAFRCKLSNHGLLQLFDIHAIPLGSVRE